MIVDGKFKGHIVGKTAQNGLDMQASEYRPIAQLKVEYASRLMQQAGHHLSRIGVDFLSKIDPAPATGAAAAQPQEPAKPA